MNKTGCTFTRGIGIVSDIDCQCVGDGLQLRHK